MKKMLNMLKNLSVKGKLSLLSGIICILMILCGINSIASLSALSNEYDHLLNTATQRRLLSTEFSASIESIMKNANNLIIQSEVYDDDKAVEELYNKTLEDMKNFKKISDSYYANASSDFSITDDARNYLLDTHSKLVDVINSYSNCIDIIYDACIKDDTNTIHSNLEEMTLLANDAENYDLELLTAAVKREDVIKQKTIHMDRVMSVLIIIISLVIIIVSIIICAIITKQITKPIKNLANASNKIAKGNFNVDVRTNNTSEIGQLSNNFALLIDSFNGIIQDMNNAFSAMSNGDIDARINTDKYEGEYAAISKNINDMLESTVNELQAIRKSAEAYAYGNFDYECPRFPGKKAILHECFDLMKKHLNEVNESMGYIIDGINNGNLNINIDTSSFNGDWKELIEKLNSLVSNVYEPISVTKNALYELSKGNFQIKIESDRYKGEFKEMLDDIENTINVLSNYIKEISDVLHTIANQDLDVSITNEYIGDFSVIQTALNLIIDNFNNLVKEIMISSDQVAAGSQSIADSSSSLAQGASEQASAVREFTSIIASVSENTKKNMENVIKSNELADIARRSAEYVKNEMNELLRAMEEINESSNNISNIIKVIDDIAFQTNILALNAAVEAARAGHHGKGFAVVADEVRNLASRSQVSAKETSELINTSLEKAEQGSVIASKTAEAIREIAKQIEEISAISTEISDGSKSQNDAISEINIGIKQIASVVENNTSTSEESAAASEQLASQSVVFKDTVSKFRLKTN